MPGVPSSRGCDACRRQKKKCDAATPSCSRCTRLRLDCVGAGQRRYKFAQPTHCREGGVNALQTSHNPVAIRSIIVYRAPENEQSALIASYAAAIGSGVSSRFSLVTGYGDYLLDVCQLLGQNEALDAAVAAVTEAHLLICRRQSPTILCLRKYSIALHRLRTSLDDPEIARSDAALYAVMVLMVCQDLIGQKQSLWTGHCEGMMQLLRARGNRWPSGQLGLKLSISVYTAVLIEAFFNRKIHLSAAELKQFASSLRTGTGAAGIVLASLCEAYGYMTLQEKGHGSGHVPASIVDDVRATCKGAVAARRELQELATLIQRKVKIGHPQQSVLEFAVQQLDRFDAMALAFCMLINLVACVYDVEDRNPLLADNIDMIREALTLAQNDANEAPLGITHILFCLYASWIAAMDHPIRTEVEAALLRYQIAMSPKPDIAAYLARMHFWRKQLYNRLGLPFSCSAGDAGDLNDAAGGGPATDEVTPEYVRETKAVSPHDFEYI